VVHRPHERHAVGGGAVVHRVQVRHEPVAEAQRGGHRLPRLGRVQPRLLDQERVARRVQAQDRREQAELHPAGGELVVAHAEDVAADVVAPPAVADVRRRGGELGLEVQRRPRDVRVAREPDRVAVAAGPRVARERERPPAVAPGVEEVEVVEHPQRVDPVDARVGALLPVEPPEVDALLLERVVHNLEVGAQELRVGDVERDRLVGRRVAPERGSHRLVRVLEPPHPVRRMHVERHAQAAAVQLGQEALGVGEQRPLPAVAGPARPVALGHRFDAVPVHVDHRHRERQALGVEPVEQLEVGVGAVAVIAAPPVAERPARQHRRAPRQRVERLERGVVVVAEGEHVRVDPAVRPRAHPAVVLEQERARVVELGDAHARHDPRVELGAAVDVVERARGPAERSHRLAVAPDAVVVADVAARLHAQAGRRERAAVVGQPQPAGDDLERGLAVDDLELGHRHVAVEREGRGAVLEHPVVGPLEPHQPVGEHGDPPPVALHHRLRPRDGRRAQSQMRLQGARAGRLPRQGRPCWSSTQAAASCPGGCGAPPGRPRSRTRRTRSRSA
jgi:hypothetical protein